MRNFTTTGVLNKDGNSSSKMDKNNNIYGNNTNNSYNIDNLGSFGLISASEQLAKSHCTYYCGQDGSIGLLLPIDEKIYRRLHDLQNFFRTTIWQPAGLDPRTFKQPENDGKFLYNNKNNILDGDLLGMFYNLAVYERRQLTRYMGTSVSQILKDLELIQGANLLL